MIFALFAASILCVVAILTIDEPVAWLFAHSFLYRDQNKFAIEAHVLLAPLLAISVCCFAWFLVQRKLSRSAEVIILATTSALLGFAINNLLLKPFFGRQTVDFFFFKPERSGFFPFEGSWKASFPSGHMVIVAAIVTILWNFFPRLYPVYIAALVFAASLLVVGEWHFVSDTIAGVIWGSVFALFILRLWRRVVPRLGY
jgi:membrane-associated phospholipid phosphatase